jgi:hypothetical protein
MHDIDRTQVGYEYESEGPSDSEQPPYNSEYAPLEEAEEMEFASALMEVDTEEEFESLLGSLLSRAVKAAGGFLSSPAGKALGGLLKGAARQILPVVQQVAGGGQAIAGEYEYEGEGEGEFEYEGEGEGEGEGGASEAEMEAMEWEAAQTFVKLAHEAAVNASQAPPNADPAAVAKKAVADAAQVHAPSLLAGPPQSPRGAMNGAAPGRGHTCGCSRKGRQAGRWIRRGNQIILLGA